MVTIADSTRKLLGNLFDLQDLGPKGPQRHRWADPCLGGSAAKFRGEPVRGVAWGPD
jgi:hypothetical protein